MGCTERIFPVTPTKGTIILCNTIDKSSTLSKGGLMHLRTVSVQVSLCCTHRLMWAETFCYLWILYMSWDHCTSWFCSLFSKINHNPLPGMPISGTSSSTGNKDMIAKLLINGETVTWLSWKHCGKRRKCSVTSNFSFSHNVFKGCLLLMRQNEYLWSKGLWIHD